MSSSVTRRDGALFEIDDSGGDQFEAVRAGGDSRLNAGFDVIRTIERDMWSCVIGRKNG